MNGTLHVFSHTHWDREWYLPFSTFRVRLAEVVDRSSVVVCCGSGGGGGVWG